MCHCVRLVLWVLILFVDTQQECVTTTAAVLFDQVSVQESWPVHGSRFTA
jgi:hypothetical protein